MKRIDPPIEVRRGRVRSVTPDGPVSISIMDALGVMRLRAGGHTAPVQYRVGSGNVGGHVAYAYRSDYHNFLWIGCLCVTKSMEREARRLIKLAARKNK